MIYKIYNDKYVAAVVEGVPALKKWLKKVPNSISETLNIEPIKYGYPIYLVETQINNKRLFFVTDKPNLKLQKAMVESMLLPVLAVYTVDKDFTGHPVEFGEDYMGVLDHVHEGE